jgi:hypothetical protein
MFRPKILTYVSFISFLNSTALPGRQLQSITYWILVWKSLGRKPVAVLAVDYNNIKMNIVEIECICLVLEREEDICIVDFSVEISRKETTCNPSCRW